MNRSHYVLAGAVVLASGVAVWQAVENAGLREANQALSAQLKTVSATVVKAPETPPPGGAGHRRGEGGRSGEFASRDQAEEGQEENQEERQRRAEREARFEQMRQLERTQRMDARMLALRTRLNLTPEQEAEIRASIEKGSSEREALRQAGEGRRRRGGRGEGGEATEEQEKARRAAWQEERAKMTASEETQEAAVKSVMTEDQLAAYEAYKTEQKAEQTETRANQQLSELQRTLSLTDEQKDAAFQYYAQMEQQDFDPGRIAAGGGDVRQAFEDRRKAEMEAMQAILTPEQYQLYSSQQEQRAQMFQNGGGRGGRGGFFRFPGGGPPR